MDDIEILELLYCRSDTALDALHRRFGHRLYATAMNILGNPQDAEEAVNDTYLALWHAIPPERPEPLAGYVFRTLRNIALKKLRFLTAQKRDCRYDLSLDELAGAISGTTPEAFTDARALGQAINAYLGTLSESNRHIFLRRYWFGDTIGQIAVQMGMRENALTVRLSRLRTGLKHYLQKEGLFYEA